MRLLVKIMSLLMLLAVVAACESPVGADTHIPSGLTNQITVNGSTYPIGAIYPASIFYLQNNRKIYLFFEVNGVGYDIHLIFISTTSQIPVGTWNSLSSGILRNVYCECPAGNVSLTSGSPGVTLDIKVSGTDGGNLTVDGTLKYETTECKFNYSGSYNYLPE